jgi:hypothetical protein
VQECDRLIDELDRVAEEKIQQYITKAEDTKKILIASLNNQTTGKASAK